MLKLEKNSNQEITFKIRDKEKIFNRTFMNAFFLAMGLHLFAIIIFQVKPFGLANSDLILPTISVETDKVLNKNQIATAETRIAEIFSRGILEPALSQISLPDIPKNTFISHIEFIHKNNSLLHPFIELEQEYHKPWLGKIEFPIISQPLLIKASGRLANRKFSSPLVEEWNDLYKEELFPKNSLKKYRVIFLVEIEDKTGEVFWFTAKETSENNLVNKIAEKFIHEIIFEKKDSSFISSGEIEFFFHLPENRLEVPHD
jgi:hypothetical protein